MYKPGQDVTLKGGKQGRIMGHHSHFGGRQWYAVVFRGDRGVRDVPEGAIVSASPVPVYEVGEEVRVRLTGRGKVVERQEDPHGTFRYRVELPPQSRGVWRGPRFVDADAAIINL